MLVVLTVAVLAPAAEMDFAQALEALRSGQAEAAAQALAAIVGKEPGNLGARFWLGRALLDSGKVAEAAAEWRQVLAQKPESTDTRYWLGVALERQGDTDGARQAWEEVLRRDRGYAAARQALAKLGKAREAPEPAAPATKPTDRPRPAHSRVVVNLGTSGLDIGTLDLLSRNVLDYTFSDAPTDWYTASGNWGTTNRWTCSPQWSWFGGMAEMGPVSAWNKHGFAGDMTVDMYIAWGMIYGYARGHYKNPNDLNISICADGTDLFSGYTFVVGGWENQRTAILRKGEVLAATDEAWALPPAFEDQDPGTYEHHRKWWGIRARKKGNVLQLYFDNRLALEAVDPAPLDRGQVALWGYDNRVVLSRVRLYYEDLVPSGAQLPAEKWAVRQQLTVDGGPAPRIGTAGVLGSGFEQTAEPVTVRDGSFTKLTLAAPGANDKGRCLKLINGGPGGTFGANLISQPVDLVKMPLLSFDYRLPAEARVNLYATVNGKLYEIVFCGREAPAALAEIAGRVPDVQADGRWHRAQLDLLGVLRRATGAWTADSLVANELWFGNLNETDYLTAGLGGNQAGTVWSLDNLYLCGPSQKVSLSPPATAGGKKIKAVAWDVNQDPTAEPSRDGAAAPAPKEVAPGKSGWWWAHVAAQAEDDTWLATAHAAVPIDVDPPQPRLVSPQPESVAGDEAIVVAFDDAGPTAVDWRTLSLSVAGKALRPGQPGVKVEPETARVIVEPAEAGLSFEDGKPVEVEVAVRDAAGNQLSGEQRWSFTCSAQQDKRGPRIAGLQVGRPYLVDADFETALPPMESYSGDSGALLTLDTSTAASGKGSLRLSNPIEYGRFGVRLVTEPFDAGVYRLVSFDYRVSPHYRGDFAVYCNGDWRAVKFCDSDQSIGYLGEVDNVVADGQWHHGEFNLYDMLVRADPKASSYTVRWFVLSDWGRMANYRRRSVWLDNLQVIPVSSSAQPLKVALNAMDPGGVAGASWVLDQLSTAAAPRKAQTESTVFEVPAPGSGQWWIHCRAWDKAGNMSEAVDRRVLLDGEQPVASPIGPAADGRAAASEVSLALLDRGIAGVDPSSVVLEVGGQGYTCENSGLTFDAAQRQLTWSCEKVQPEPVVFKDGQTVTVRLAKATDYAGNESETHPMWNWVMDYRMDNVPPPVATIDSATHRTFLTETFEGGLGQWASPGGTNGAKVDLDTSSPADGKAAVKLTQVQGGSLMQAYACRTTFYAEAYPMIAFDYNFRPGVHLDLMVLCNGQWFAVAMSDNPAGAVGRVPDIVADGKWHHASVNVFPLLRRTIQKGSLAVTQVLITDRNSADNQPGAVALFDNFVIGQIGNGAAKLAWRATDATGIQGYSYVVDRKGGTEPDTQAETTERALVLSKLETGLWYLHVRAQDGAGNWGPASHYAILNGNAG